MVIFLTDGGNWTAISEPIPSKTFEATANRWVVDHSTVCVGSAWSRTRIDAFLVDASTIRLTIRTDGTFRSTVGCTTDHIRHARALRLSGHHLALRIGSARWWIARVGRKWWRSSFLYYRVRNWFYKWSTTQFMGNKSRPRYVNNRQWNPAYWELCGNQCKDHQCNLTDKHRWDCGQQLGILNLSRKSLYKDLDISDWDKQEKVNIQN